MGRSIVLPLCLAVAACVRPPAPVEAVGTATPPADVAAATVADAPATPGAVAGERCWMAQHDRSLRWNDPTVAVEWNLGGEAPLLAPKDAAAPLLSAGEVFS